MRLIATVFTISLAFSLISPLWGQTKSPDQSKSKPNIETNVQKIWDRGKHNAFTDLIRFNDLYVCTFRESNSHVPRNRAGDGKIRLITSEDGNSWKNWHLIEKEAVDLRDPKLSITVEGKLMVLCGGSYYESGKLQKRIPFVSFYDLKSKQWTQPRPIEVDAKIKSSVDWLWRVTWHRGTGYGVIYQPVENNWGLHLVKTSYGIKYDLIKTLKLDGKPNETTVRFDHAGNMLLVVRNENGKSEGHFGFSRPPFDKWRWAKIPQRLGGPNFLILPSGIMVLGSRSYEKTTRTQLSALARNGKIRPFLTFPSGGDTSYPGMIMHDNQLWVSYYSSHEGKSNIYLFRESLNNVEKVAGLAMHPARTRFKKEIFESADGKKLLCRTLYPKKIETKKKYPLVLFLHGAGERGNNNKAQLVHGMDDFASDKIMAGYPAFVIAPQCPRNKKWVEVDWSASRHDIPARPSQSMKLTMEMLDKFIAHHPVDKNRIYITGLSMGGFGTWDAITRKPNLFAAAVPICGGGDSRAEIVKKIKHIPVWVIHGDKDRAVPPKRSKDMVAALKKLGAQPKFNLRRNTGHDSWTATYSDPEFYRWLFDQRKK